MVVLQSFKTHFPGPLQQFVPSIQWPVFVFCLNLESYNLPVASFQCFNTPETFHLFPVLNLLRHHITSVFFCFCRCFQFLPHSVSIFPVFILFGVFIFSFPSFVVLSSFCISVCTSFQVLPDSVDISTCYFSLYPSL